MSVASRRRAARGPSTAPPHCSWPWSRRTRRRTLDELAGAEALPRSTDGAAAAALERRGLRAARRRAARCGRARCSSPTPAAARRTPTSSRSPSPALQRLAEVSGETSNLVVPRLDGVECVAQVDGRFLLGGANWVGRRVPLPRVGGAARRSWPGASCRCPRAAWRGSRRAPSRPARHWRASWSRCASGAGPRRSTSWRPASRPSARRCTRPSGAVVAALTLSRAAVRLGDDRLDELGAAPRRGGRRCSPPGSATADGKEVGMNEDEILQALYDETLVGNAPRVLELTNLALEHGHGPGDAALRRADPGARGGRARASSAATSSCPRC